MKLLYKSPSKETKTAMAEASENYQVFERENSYLREAEAKVISKTGHLHGKIVNSGNAAILVAMNAIEGPIIIPDQGAWHGFKQIAKFLNKEVITLKTDLGLIDKENLDELLDLNPNIKTNSYSSGVFLTSFAGYTAEQPIKEIANWCQKHDVLLVEDVSGAICDSEKKLANGRYSDIIIGSTGSPKIVNVGDGGFITTNRADIFEKSKLLLKIAKSSDVTNRGIATELDFTEGNLKKTIKATKYVKDNLENVIHQDKRGINVIVGVWDPQNLAKSLRIKFNVEGKSIVTMCPNYNRVKKRAIAIEIKNLAIECLRKDNLDEIVDYINNAKF